MQDTHGPSQAVSQQIPSTQNPLSLSTPVGSGTDWSEVLSEVAALGVGIAEAFGGMAASGNAGQPLVN